MGGVDPGSKRIRRGGIDDVDFRHRDSGRDGHLLDHIEELRIIRLLQTARAADGQQRPRSAEPGGQEHDNRRHRRDQQSPLETSAGAAENSAEQQQEREHAGNQEHAVALVRRNQLLKRLPGPHRQNLTFGASRSDASVICQSSASRKWNMPAMTLAGNTAIAVLKFVAVSL